MAGLHFIFKDDQKKLFEILGIDFDDEFVEKVLLLQEKDISVSGVSIPAETFGREELIKDIEKQNYTYTDKLFNSMLADNSIT